MNKDVTWQHPGALREIHGWFNEVVVPPRAASVMTASRVAIVRFAYDDSGQDVVEYGMIIATIAIFVLVVVAAFGQKIEPWFQSLAGRITTTGTS
jgi:Flp pilus assembly pilin Flp